MAFSDRRDIGTHGSSWAGKTANFSITLFLI